MNKTKHSLSKILFKQINPKLTLEFDLIPWKYLQQLHYSKDFSNFAEKNPADIRCEL